VDGLRTRCKDCQKQSSDKNNLPAVVEQKPRCGLLELVTEEKPQVYCRGVQLFTTSLDVARNFGKEHKDVLKRIDSIISDSEENGRRNFTPTSYTDSWNRQQDMYKLTRDAFSILVMGFTGPEALAWK
jgi:Rha family phage regulatory protein